MAPKINIANITAGMNKVQAKASALDTLAKTELVPTEFIKLAENNPYASEDTDESLQELAADIDTSGLIHSLVVNKKSDTKYQLISGERRFKAITAYLHWPRIECRVFENVSDDKAQLMLHSANLAAREYTNAQKLTFYKEMDTLLEHMKESGEFSGAKQKRLAELLGVSTRQIRRYQTVTTLPEEQQQSVVDGSLSMKEALKLAQPKQEALPILSLNSVPPLPAPYSSNAPAQISEVWLGKETMQESRDEKSSSGNIKETGPGSAFDADFWDDKIHCAIKDHYDTKKLYLYYIFQVPTTQEAIKEVLKPKYGYEGGTVDFADGTRGYFTCRSSAAELEYKRQRQEFSYSQIDSYVRQLIRSGQFISKDKQKALLQEHLEGENR